MPHRTFSLFILPSALAMLLFIALPILSVVVQSLYVENDRVLVEVENCGPFGCQKEVRIDTEATAKQQLENPLGQFNGLGTYFNRNHLATEQVSEIWSSAEGVGDFFVQLYGLPFRYGDLKPCRTAFIDAHTPGSNQKENFTIIGGGVSESPDQHVHLRETPGFNIGAAGQPPKCRNSLHSHRTAEVFFVLKGRWRFFWGRWGNAGEVVLEEGDIINIPTGIFRGFENIGTDYGMIMAILGGDDAGGGVVWAPQVINDAKDHGLVLGENGKLYDTKKGQLLPEGINPMPLLTDEELKSFPEPTTLDVIPNYVARYWDLMALSDRQPAKVIAGDGILKDRPGFEVEFLSRNSLSDALYTLDRHEILMPMRGYWRLTWDGGTTVLNPGDTAAVPPGLSHSLTPSMTGEASLYRVINTDDTAGATGLLL